MMAVAVVREAPLPEQQGASPAAGVRVAVALAGADLVEAAMEEVARAAAVTEAEARVGVVELARAAH